MMLIIGFTCPPIIHFQFITKCDGLLLQSATEQRSLFLVDGVDSSRSAAICGISTSSQLGFSTPIAYIFFLRHAHSTCLVGGRSTFGSGAPKCSWLGLLLAAKIVGVSFL